MRILHCNDLHAKTAWYHWLIKKSAEFDLVCIAGDLLFLNIHRAFGAEVDQVVRHLRQIKTPLAICSGNHDSLDCDDSRLVGAAWLHDLRAPKVWVDGDVFALGGHTFRVIGWSSPLPAAEAPGEIFITHCPPEKCATGIVRGGVDFGSFDLGDLCRNPDPNRMAPWAALSGHCHDRQRWWAKVGRTWSFNPGRFDGPWPSHIVLDLARNTATYHAPGAGETRISLAPG